MSAVPESVSTEMPLPLVFSESAANKVADLIAEEGNPDLKLRVFVQGGGCSGFQYALAFDTQREDDEVFEFRLPGDQGPRRYRCAVHTWRPAVGDGFVLLRVARNAQGGWGVRASFDHAGGQEAVDIVLAA
jgi:hypothetical protein